MVDFDLWKRPALEEADLHKTLDGLMDVVDVSRAHILFRSRSCSVPEQNRTNEQTRREERSKVYLGPPPLVIYPCCESHCKLLSSECFRRSIPVRYGQAGAKRYGLLSECVPIVKIRQLYLWKSRAGSSHNGWFFSWANV